ncbi:MAG TPA: hypothetical protein VKP11_05080, partial [Frankiaceae bacterium]|nr:hypothetical protein [Frankiaceae bacterium]
MRWGKALQVVRMQRVALAAPRSRLRDLLVEVADAGTVELDLLADSAPDGHELPAVAALRRVPATAGPAPEPVLASAPPDLEELVAAGRSDLLAGEAELQRRAAGAVERGSVAALSGWTPVDDLPALAGRLAPVGAAVAPLPPPRGVEPPSRLRGGSWSGVVRPLVETYAAVPYADLDPTLLAGLAYVVM